MSERISLVAFLAGAAALTYFAPRIETPVLIGLAYGLVLAFCLTQRAMIRGLFGPVLFYEIVRLARKRRNAVLRFLYVIALAAIFCWLYGIWSDHVYDRYGSRVPPHEQAQFAEIFFSIYMFCQAAVAAVLTPAYTAGAIAEEKERRTLEFLLATDLRAREIIFGKFAARVGNLLLFLIAGLPILAIVQFFGGIDPELLLAGFLATLLMTLGLAAVGLFASTISRRARDAIVLTYLMAIGYVGVSQLLGVVAFAVGLIPGPVLPGYSALEWSRLSVWLTDAWDVFAAGDPLHAVVTVVPAMATGGAKATLADALRDFALFHLVLVAACVGYSAWRLRPLTLRELGQSKAAPPRRGGRERAPSRPDVGTAPMVWKEVFVEGGLKLNLFGKFIALFFFALSMAPPGIIVAVVFWDEPIGQIWEPELWHDIGEGFNGWVRAAGTIVCSLLLLGVAVRGAGSVTGERERQSLDSLLIAPLEAKDILWGKWCGCVFGMRRGWFWLLLIWLVAAAGGGLHPAALPGLFIATAVYAAAFAWLGIYFSVNSTTTLRATIKTVMAGLFLGGGYFIAFGVCCIMPLELVGGFRGNDLDEVVSFLVGFCPPAVESWLPFFEFDEWEMNYVHHRTSFVPFALVGVFGWLVLSLIFAGLSISQFARKTNRGGSNGPDYDRPPPARRRPGPAPITEWE